MSGEGPYIISNREDLDSSSSLRLAELERGSVMRRSVESVPRDSSKIFKVIDKAQVCMYRPRQREILITDINININQIINKYYK